MGGEEVHRCYQCGEDIVCTPSGWEMMAHEESCKQRMKEREQQEQREKEWSKRREEERLQDQRIVESLESEIDPQLVAKSLIQTTSPSVIDAARKAFVRIGKPSLPVLTEALLSQSSLQRTLRIQAAITLGKIGDRSAAPYLLRAFLAKDPDVRDAARQSLKQLDAYSVFTALSYHRKLVISVLVVIAIVSSILSLIVN